MEEYKKVEKVFVFPFKCMDERYGRAEFEVCFDYKRGALKGFWVTSKQQTEKHKYHYIGHCDLAFTINSYEGLADPRPWLFGWCKRHNSPFCSIYVPNGAKFLRLDNHGISFLKTVW